MCYFILGLQCIKCFGGMMSSVFVKKVATLKKNACFVCHDTYLFTFHTQQAM